MANFDFISSKDFRNSLECDYSEMLRNFEAKSWKSVQVVAGSIVETLLIDYLTSTECPTRPKKDLLKIVLSDAISIARAEGILSERTSDLCSVIKSYRNLIHPGKMVRLGESLPNKETASIALSLVDIILEELSKSRRASMGLVAEQLVSKILKDRNSTTLMKHLITEVNNHQKERLLLELIPPTHKDLPWNSTIDDDPFEIIAKVERLQIAYRAILESANPELKKLVANEFVRILREESGDFIDNYSKAFFKFSDLAYVQPQHQEMVYEHLLGRIPAMLEPEGLPLLDGIEKALKQKDVAKWLDPYIKSILTNTISAKDQSELRTHLLQVAGNLGDTFEEAIDRRFDDWIRHYEKAKMLERVGTVKELKGDVEYQRIPF